MFSWTAVRESAQVTRLGTRRQSGAKQQGANASTPAKALVEGLVKRDRLRGGAAIRAFRGGNHRGRSFSELSDPAVDTTVTQACAVSRKFIARLPGSAMKLRRTEGALGLLACLLAQDFFHLCFHLQFQASDSAAYLAGYSHSYGLIRLHNGGAPNVSQNTWYSSRSTHRHPSVIVRKRTRAAPSAMQRCSRAFLLAPRR